MKDRIINKAERKRAKIELKEMRQAQRARIREKIHKLYYGSKLHKFFVNRKVKRFLQKENNLRPSLIDRIRSIKIRIKNKKILKE